MRTIGYLFLALCVAPLSANDFSFTGTFAQDDDVRFFTFTLTAPSTVALRSLGYGGGTNAAGAVIPAGGFDTILTLYDAAGNVIASNDDGLSPPVNIDPATGEAFDAFLAISLPAGTYRVALTQFNNFNAGPTLADGFAQTGSPNFSAIWGCSNGQFCDTSTPSSNRTPAWALDITGVSTATPGITAPPATGPALITCVSTAVPPAVRAEGIAELVGDIVIACTPTPGTGQRDRYRVNVSVSLNVNVTNNVGFSAAGVTDAVLIVNENNCATPSALGATFVCGPDSRFQDPQFGRLAASNRLEWNQVDIPFPGFDPDGPGPAPPFPAVTTLRVTSVRGNAAQLGAPDSATFPSTQIAAFVSITGPTTIPVTNNVLNVAVPILGLIASGPTGVAGIQCVSSTSTTSIRLREGFATAFKTLGAPTFAKGVTQWESGYHAPGSNNGGGAWRATRFILRFFNIPQGVSVSVPNTIQNGSAAVNGDALELRIVNGADDRGVTGLAGPANIGASTVALSGGFGYVVYEVHDSNPFVTESVDVPLTLSWTANTANDLPAVGTGRVSASFAPLSTVLTASLAEPEPRFVDNAGPPRNLIAIARCTTTLLFPFVTNQVGFDTGFAIANTSRDWLGTQPQRGACTIHYHGTTTGGGAAPPDQTSTVLEAGQQLLFTLSAGGPAQGIAGAPGFHGYVIAVCNFQYAHGFAFITDGYGGLPALAQGYLALVIPWTGAPNGRLTGANSLSPLSESLGR